MPVLGIFASQITGKLYAPTGSMYHIASTTLSSAAADVTFSSIAADYTHLQIRFFAAGTLASADHVGLAMVVNTDTAANYSLHLLTGDGSSASADGASGSSSISGLPRIPAPPTNASVFGAGVIDILDYANTSKYKTTRSLGGNDRNGAGTIRFSSGNWRNTAAITSLKLYVADGGNLATYSSFSLYGVK